MDSVDSVLMLYSYTGFVGHSWRIFEPSSSPSRTTDARSVNTHGEVSLTKERTVEVSPATANEVAPADQPCNGIENESRTVDNVAHDSDSDAARREHSDRMVMVKRSTMSELSITLTTMSILLAFRSVNEVAIRPMTGLILRSISLIEIMGLIGGNCGRCQAAASAPDGGGLAGMWWRGWAQVSRGWHAWWG